MDAVRTMTELAELANQLRRFRSGPGDRLPPGVRRLTVAGRLVARLGRETGTDEALTLGETASTLARAAGGAPSAMDARLLGLLTALADLLEDLLGAVDEGVSPAAFLARCDWARYRPGGAPPNPAAPVPGPVLLLVASEFRRAILSDRLEAADLPCEIVADPHGALARLERAPRPRWVVCDDLEPTRHLGRLRALLAGAPGERPLLVLLAPGGAARANAPLDGPPETPEILAARRGADHLWREPFDPADLPV